MSRRISCRHDGRRVALPVTIFAPFPYDALAGIEALALVDTGSTTSAVTRSIAARLALPHRGKRVMSGLGGEVIVTRRALRIGFSPDREVGGPPEFPYVFDEIIGFELHDGFSCEALIGMDILARCDLHVLRNHLAQLDLP